MHFISRKPPREFRVGRNHEITLRDCGSLQLDTNEQITFVTPSGTEYDVTRKSWGYYATPSLNKRLRLFRLRAVLTEGLAGTFFVLLVEDGKENEFRRYLDESGMRLVTWLDSDEAIHQISQMRDKSGSEDK